MNHHHIDRRRVARSAECRTGEPPTAPAEIAALVRKARRAGVIVFLRHELERLPDMARALIEGEHKRICQKGGR